MAPTTPAPADRNRITFPPFPDPPDGVQVIPFKDFRECGIQMFSGENEIEVDGLGIPTVELKSKHVTDGCKTHSKRPIRKAITAQNPTERKVRLEWWQQWAAGEDLRVTSFDYNPNGPRIDRLHQAATDFKNNRTWPPNITSVHEIWNQYLLFVGLLTNTPIWNKTDKNVDEHSPEDEDYLSDEEAVAEPKIDITVEDGTGGGKRETSSRSRPRPPYATYGKEPHEVNTEGEIQELLDEAHSAKDEKINDFLNDPEKSTKIFLSSYMRNQGLIWSDRNLINVPQLVGFFVNFLLRNRVLPESERQLRRALEVVNMAKKELPLTSTIGKALPDDFSKACAKCWGSVHDGFVDSSGGDGVLDKERSDEDRYAKRQKFDHNGDILSPKSTPIVERDPGEADFEAELKAANVQVIPAHDINLIKQIVDDNVGSDVHVHTSDWGSGDGTWGQDSPWGAPASTDVDVSGWVVPEISLQSIGGPTALPETHTTGVVESSLRRIKAVILPVVSQPHAPSSIEGERDADAVEAELGSKYAKVTLEPWLGWDKTGEEEICQPMILSKSKGPVIGPDGLQIECSEKTTKTGGKVHNVRRDDITILVPASVVDCLGIGMGLAASWIQIVRRSVDETSQGKAPSKKNKKNKKATANFWYMEQLVLIIPSYYST